MPDQRFYDNQKFGDGFDAIDDETWALEQPDQVPPSAPAARPSAPQQPAAARGQYAAQAPYAAQDRCAGPSSRAAQNQYPAQDQYPAQNQHPAQDQYLTPGSCSAQPASAPSSYPAP